MTDGRPVPERAREFGARLAELFERDRALALALNEAHARLRAASASLWDGLHPDALGPLYDEHTPAPVPPAFAASSSVLPLAEDAPLDRTAILSSLQQTHWRIQRAFGDYQRASEDRRVVAADIGECTAQLVAVLCAAGFSDDEARGADVRELAAGVLAVPDERG